MTQGPHFMIVIPDPGHTLSFPLSPPYTHQRQHSVYSRPSLYDVFSHHQNKHKQHRVSSPTPSSLYDVSSSSTRNPKTEKNPRVRAKIPNREKSRDKDKNQSQRENPRQRNHCHFMTCSHHQHRHHRQFMTSPFHPPRDSEPEKQPSLYDLFSPPNTIVN
jgi:hypothetical protein